MGFRRAAVAAAGVLAFSGLAIGAAQAADLPYVETPGDAATDCFTAENQREMDMGAGHHVTIVHCERDPRNPGSMFVFYRN
ncbi:hypothetical protein ACWFRJ_19335 [Streptomyces sp. NPDC055239]